MPWYIIVLYIMLAICTLLMLWEDHKRWKAQSARFDALLNELQEELEKSKRCSDD